MALRAYGPFVVLRREDAPSKGLVVEPDNVQKTTQRCRVVSIGEGALIGLHVGDAVIYAGFAFAVGDLLVVKHENILAIEGEES